MKKFTLGPVEMYPGTKSIRNRELIYFRTKEYGAFVKKTLSRLSNLLGVERENAMIYMANSGTGAMEAAVENCITKEEKALVINGGTFGRRFCELLEYHNIPFSSIDLAWNELLTKEHLDKFNNKDYTHLFVNHHETSTGKLYDIKMLSEFCQNNGMFLIVDAISSFLADDYDMDKYNIDLTIISSQKGLCLSPGMAMVAFSERMKEKVLNNSNKCSSLYFDFKDYLINMERGQTPYTPTVCVMYELADMLDLIDSKGGRDLWLHSIREKCEYFRNKAQALGFEIPDYPLSDMLTPLYFEDGIAYKIFERLKDKYNIYVNPCGGELADKLLRISHVGNTTIQDIDDLLEKMLICRKETNAYCFCYEREKQ